MPVKIKATCEQYVDIEGVDHYLEDKEKMVSEVLAAAEIYKGDFKGSHLSTSMGFLASFLFRKQELYGRFKTVSFTHRPGGPLQITNSAKCFKKADHAMMEAVSRLTGDDPPEVIEAQKSFDGTQFYVAITNQGYEREDCIDIWQVSIVQSV